MNMSDLNGVYTEKTVKINGETINFAEGPDQGLPLLLIHAQMVHWKSYFPVLLDLAKDFHVYAVDCPGHGKSSKNPA